MHACSKTMYNSIQKLTHKLLHSFRKNRKFLHTNKTYGEYIIDLFLSPLQSTFFVLKFSGNKFLLISVFPNGKFLFFNYEKNVFIDLKILFCFTLNVNKKTKRGKYKKNVWNDYFNSNKLLVTFYELNYFFVNKSVT